jgi:hypothetical protein
VLRYSALHCLLFYSAVLYCIVLHCTALLLCITLLCFSGLPYTTAVTVTGTATAREDYTLHIHSTAQHSIALSHHSSETVILDDDRDSDDGSSD